MSHQWGAMDRSQLTQSKNPTSPTVSVRVITVFTVFRLLTDFVCLYNYEFWLSLCKIVRSSVILLLPLFRIHRRITRQHPRLHQNPHLKNSTPNISTRCKRNSYITSIPIDFVLPKLLNYLAFKSFDFSVPDEGYSKSVS